VVEVKTDKRREREKEKGEIKDRRDRPPKEEGQKEGFFDGRRSISHHQGDLQI
jgi:hypothetical protein